MKRALYLFLLLVLFMLLLNELQHDNKTKHRRSKSKTTDIAQNQEVTAKSKVKTPPPADFSKVLEQAQKPLMSNQNYRFVRAKDGDTIVVEGSDGQDTVRLLGIDTPEMKDSRQQMRYFAEQAKRFVIGLLEGKEVQLGFDPVNQSRHHRDIYGRLLAYVFTDKGETFVNAEIVRQGYGFSFVKYPCMYTSFFSDLERQAREDGVGMWGE